MKNLLSEIRNVYMRAVATNHAGSCESADSLNMCAALQNLVIYVERTIGAGQGLLIVEEQERIILCPLSFPIITAVLTAQHTLRNLLNIM